MFSIRRGALLGSVLLCLCFVSSFGAALSQSTTPSRSAQPPALPTYIEEFFLSEGVRSENRGELQFTLDAIKQKNHRSPEDGSSAELDIEYGMTDRLQFGLELPYGIQSTAFSALPRRWSSVSPSLLYQFVRSNRPFALCLAMGVDLPLNSQGDVGYEPQILVAKGIGTFQIHSSFIPEFDEEGTSLAYNVAALRPVAHHFIPTLEWNGRRQGGVNTEYLTPGLYKHLPHHLEVGAAAPVGLSKRSSPVGVVVKMTWELGDDDD